MTARDRLRKAWVEGMRLYPWTAVYVCACLTVIVLLMVWDTIRETT